MSFDPPGIIRPYDKEVVVDFFGTPSRHSGFTTDPVRSTSAFYTGSRNGSNTLGDYCEYDKQFGPGYTFSLDVGYLSDAAGGIVTIKVGGQLLSALGATAGTGATGDTIDTRAAAAGKWAHWTGIAIPANGGGLLAVRFEVTGTSLASSYKAQLSRAIFRAA